MSQAYGFNDITGYAVEAPRVAIQNVNSLGDPEIFIPPAGSAEHQFADTDDSRFTVRRDAGSTKLGVVGLVAVLGLGALGYKTVKEKLGDLPCIATDVSECNLGLPTEPNETPPQFNDITKAGERLIGKTSVLTFGTGEVELTAKGKLDYDLPIWHMKSTPWFGAVEGTMHLEATKENPAKFYYEPCIVADSESGTVPAPDSYEAIIELENARAQEALSGPDQNISEITVYQDVDATGRITGYRVLTGSVEPCHMRMPTTEYADAVGGETIFRPDGKIGEGHRKTLQAMSRHILTLYAEAVACPEAIVDIEDVKDKIRVIAVGMITREDPSAFVGRTPEEVTALVDVIIASSVESQQKRMQNFEEAKAHMSTIRETVGDTDGNTHKIEPAVFDSIAMESCTPAADVSVREVKD